MIGFIENHQNTYPRDPDRQWNQCDDLFSSLMNRSRIHHYDFMLAIVIIIAATCELTCV